MEDEVILSREDVPIEGGRHLYNYTFRNAEAMDRLLAIIEGGEVGVVGPFLDQHPGLDVAKALEVARKLGNAEAIAEIEARRPAKS